MSNPLNNGVLTGRVAQDIREFPNADGSKVLLTTIAVEDNFVSGADRKAKTQFVPVRIFLAKTVNGRGSWDRVHKGDLISVGTRIACEPYEKDGETVYPAPTVEVDGFPQFLESKSTVEARVARNAVAAAPAEPAEESQDETIARLQAQLAAAQGVDVDATSPFATV